MVIKTGGRAGGVRDNIVLQPLNGLPGLAARTLPKRTTAPCGFFVCGARLHLSMVGRAGEPKGSPGSLVTGLLTPYVSPPNCLAAFGGDIQNTKGVKP